jgi:hypothetical protein
VKRSALDEETFLRFLRTLDEHQARLCAVERALALGRGGITLVSRVTGLSYPTIHKGITELRTNSTTKTGLTVDAVIHTMVYRTGWTVTNALMRTLNLEPHIVCPAWSYTLHPRRVAHA